MLPSALFIAIFFRVALRNSRDLEGKLDRDISVWKCHLKLYFICALIFVLSVLTQQKTKYKRLQKSRFGYSMCREFFAGAGWT